jgi:putative DNA primase/helicase
VFTRDGRVVGVDFDHCRHPRTRAIDPQVLSSVKRLDSYTEISPSGTGLHVYVLGALPPGRRKRLRIEMYDSERYFCVTGSHLPGTPTTIEERSDVLAALHAETFGPPIPPAYPTPSPLARQVTRSDAALLMRIRFSRNGKRFARLWRGDITGYASHSEADLALCGALAYCKPHPNSLDTILTNPMMVIKEDGDGQQTWETDATQQ